MITMHASFPTSVKVLKNIPDFDRIIIAYANRRYGKAIRQERSDLIAFFIMIRGGGNTNRPELLLLKVFPLT